MSNAGDYDGDNETDSYLSVQDALEHKLNVYEGLPCIGYVPFAFLFFTYCIKLIRCPSHSVVLKPFKWYRQAENISESQFSSGAQPDAGQG